MLDAARRELRRGGVLLALEPQIFDLLEYLIRQRQRVVGRDELLNAVWGGRIVSDSAIDTRISAARQAIGDSGAKQRLIRTLRTKGLRFIGFVREEASPRAARAAEDGGSRALLSDYPTIAVLPLANPVGNAELEPLADGITEDLITALSKIGWLFVATRASSFACKGQTAGTTQVARKLGVRYLLDGGIRRIADRLRVTMQLVDGLADHQVWAERYDLDIGDGFTMQDEICAKVASAIEPQLYLAEHLRAQRKSPEALSGWECIVRALALMNSRDQRHVTAGHAFLQNATSIDPESAQAHSLLSMATTLRVHMSWADRKDVIPAALASARTALLLNPDEAWAHAALGYASTWTRPDDAIVPCQRAIALNPNFAVGHYFLALAATYAGHHDGGAGRADSIFAHADMAERLAPRDLLARGYAGAHDNVRATACFAIEQYREGMKFAGSAALYSPNSPTAHRALVINSALAGKSDEARQALGTLRRLAPEMSQGWIKQNAVWASDATMKRYVEAFRAAGLK